MQRTSVIDHPSRNSFLLLRSDFIDLCKGDHCAAALLALFEYVTNGGSADDTSPYDIRIQRSWDGFSEDLLGLYARTKIGQSLQFLINEGLIDALTEPGVVTIYWLSIDKINDLLTDLPSVPVRKRTGTSPKTDTLPVRKRIRDSSLKKVEEEREEGGPLEIKPLIHPKIDKALKATLEAVGQDWRPPGGFVAQLKKAEKWNETLEAAEVWRGQIQERIAEYLADPSRGTIWQAILPSGGRLHKSGRMTGTASRAPGEPGLAQLHRGSHTPQPVLLDESPARKRIRARFTDQKLYVNGELEWKWNKIESQLADQGDAFWPWLEGIIEGKIKLGLGGGAIFEYVFDECSRRSKRRSTIEEDIMASMKGEEL